LEKLKEAFHGVPAAIAVKVALLPATPVWEIFTLAT